MTSEAKGTETPKPKGIWAWLTTPLYNSFATDWPGRFGPRKGPSRLEAILTVAVIIVAGYFLIPYMVSQIA